MFLPAIIQAGMGVVGSTRIAADDKSLSNPERLHQGRAPNYLIQLNTGLDRPAGSPARAAIVIEHRPMERRE
jgi:hypothetical protein